VDEILIAPRRTTLAVANHDEVHQHDDENYAGSGQDRSESSRRG
jgi:hypothetical protein